MKIRKNKRFLSLLLGMILTLSTGMTAFAAEPVSKATGVPAPPPIQEAFLEDCSTIVETDGSNAIMPLSNLYGYAAGYASTELTSFYINVSGDSTSRGGFTVETYSFNSSTVKIGITLYRPDGSVATNTLIEGNKKVENLSFSNAPSGKYRVGVHVYGAAQGWVGGWVFKK